MPAHLVDPGVDEEREHEAVERAAHDDAGEERQDELDPTHRAAAEGLTARTFPAGGPGSRPGLDQRAVMVSMVAAEGSGYQLADWAISWCCDPRSQRIIRRL